jgi:ring-1,2-phenylacetyl-CoA epoxidase subunit PaaC
METQNALFYYCLRLADNNLILGQRLGELCGHGPLLEEDVALTNIALDLMGQARALLAYAATIENKGRSDDDLAFLRSEREFYNTLLVEQPNTDFAYIIARQFFVDAFDYYFYQQLTQSKDETLAALAAKGIKEVTYHLRHSSQWVERLGDGTEESHKRIQQAINDLWTFTGELFEITPHDTLLLKEGIAVDLALIQPQWNEHVNKVFEKATLQLPQNTWMQRGSREGKHTEHLGYLLAEMQHLHRAYPGVNW